MPALGYGLNITKKPSSLASRPPPAKRKTIFDDDSGPEDGPDEEQVVAVGTIGGLDSKLETPASSMKENNLKSSVQTNCKKPSKISQYGDLSTNHSSTRHAATAQELDPNIYDYDSVYDSLHAKPATAADSGPKGPKYMQNLFAAAEVRKRDQLRAKDKLLAKEREAEGNEYDDKEKFVTEAYKTQQEELRKMEEEEAERERKEEERRRREGGGMVGLYKDLLNKNEQHHNEQLKAAEEAKANSSATTEASPPPQAKEKDEVELAKEKGAIINEDGQVVDKRQLLSAGLNIAPKPKLKPDSSASSTPSFRLGGLAPGLQNKAATKQAARERQTRMLEAQLEEASKRAADDEEVEREALERAAKSRKTASDVQSAKERYLQRKREAAAVATAGKIGEAG
ncbi:MAG: hypothetical protein MMC33_005346 [Icmadophila ericetorum]|nr:hypothetical protein [Icmadophila ericetorum]